MSKQSDNNGVEKKKKGGKQKKSLLEQEEETMLAEKSKQNYLKPAEFIIDRIKWDATLSKV